MLDHSVRDRIELARQYLAFAQSIALASECHGRQVISRSYYAMHHAARAVVFAVTRQDITSHEGVIREIRRRLGEHAADLLERQLNLCNDVEYEVYPRVTVMALSQEACEVAAEFITDCETSLTRRA